MANWRHWTLLALTLGAGCSLETGKGGDEDEDSDEDEDEDGGIDLGAEPACPHDISGWASTLGTVVGHAGGDGTIDMPTVAPYIDAITGTFDASTGSFSFTRRYAEGNRTDHRTSEGSGSFEANGDHTATLTEVTVDRLGAERIFHQDITRTGCDISVVYTPDDEDSAFSPYVETREIVDADTIQSHLETVWNGMDWVEDRTARSDHTTAYSFTIDDDLYTVSGTYNADGTHDREMVYLSDNARQESIHAYAANGDYTREMAGYSYDDGSLIQEFDAAFVYEGGATGTYRFIDGEGAWVTCDYTRDDDDTPDCAYAYACDNGEDYGGEC